MKTNRRPPRSAPRLRPSLVMSLLLGLGCLSLAFVPPLTKSGATVVVLTPDELARARAALPGI